MHVGTDLSGFPPIPLTLPLMLHGSVSWQLKQSSLTQNKNPHQEKLSYPYEGLYIAFNQDALPNRWRWTIRKSLKMIRQ